MHIRKISKIIVSLIFLLALSFNLGSCFNRGYNKETNPLKYLKFELLDDDTYTVKGFNGRPVEDIVIPSSYNNKPVSTISKNAFKRFGYFQPLQSFKLTIQEGIKIIEEQAFNNTGLKEVLLPESLEFIGNEAFERNETKINYVDNLKYIGDYAFAGTYLSGTINIKNIEIGNGAFINTKINKVIFDNDVSIIGSWFNGCELLNEIILPDSLEIIQKNAFRNAGFTELVFNKDILIEENAFSYMKNLKSVTFNSDNIIIEPYSFSNNEKLNNIKFGMLTEISASSFTHSPLNSMSVSEDNQHYKVIDNGRGLVIKSNNSLLIGGSNFNSFDTISSIEVSAFEGKKLGDVIIPSNVSIVHRKAFYNATFNSLDIRANQIYTEAFSYINILNDDLYISSKEIGSDSFNYAKGFKRLHIMVGNEIIKSGSFTNNFSIEELYLPTTLKTIEIGAFIQCHNLKSVYYRNDNIESVVKLYTGNFIIYKSNIVENGWQINTNVYSDFRIFVNKDIYDYVLNFWSEMPEGEKYIYNNNLKDYIYIK